MGSPASEDILTTARYIKLRIKKANMGEKSKPPIAGKKTLKGLHI